jgi:hypothetical protein
MGDGFTAVIFENQRNVVAGAYPLQQFAIPFQHGHGTWRTDSANKIDYVSAFEISGFGEFSLRIHGRYPDVEFNYGEQHQTPKQDFNMYQATMLERTPETFNLNVAPHFGFTVTIIAQAPAPTVRNHAGRPGMMAECPAMVTTHPSCVQYARHTARRHHAPSTYPAHQRPRHGQAAMPRVGHGAFNNCFSARKSLPMMETRLLGLDSWRRIQHPRRIERRFPAARHLGRCAKPSW